MDNYNELMREKTELVLGVPGMSLFALCEPEPLRADHSVIEQTQLKKDLVSSQPLPLLSPLS